DADVHDHCAGLHQLEVLAGDEHRTARPGNQDGADYQVGLGQVLANGDRCAVDRGYIGRHNLVEVAQAVEVDVHQLDVGPEAGGEAGGAGADDAATQHHHVSRLDTRDAPQQYAAAHHGAFEV